MENNKKRVDLTWQEKREQRFNRWLYPPNVNFTNAQAENLYRERVTRFIKAIRLEEPDHVHRNAAYRQFPAISRRSEFTHDNVWP